MCNFVFLVWCESTGMELYMFKYDGCETIYTYGGPLSQGDHDTRQFVAALSLRHTSENILFAKVFGHYFLLVIHH